MANKKYHGADATVTIKTSSGTDLNAGELRGVTITPSFEVDELYSADSVLRSAVKQRNFSVTVEATIAAFDVTMIQQFLGGSGATSTGVVDTTDPALFTVDASVTPEDGSTNLNAVVTGVYFPELPVFSDVSHDSWVEESISGVGEDLTVTGA